MLIYLVGNRVDLEEIREVKVVEGQKCMTTHKLDNFFETSAISGENIKEVF